MSKNATVERLTRTKVVAILRGLEPHRLEPTVEALLAGGITALEITLNSPAALEGIRAASALVGDRALVGAGTVLDAASVTAAVLAGAQFVVAPNCNEAVIRAAHRHGAAAIPGAMTPTEITAAMEAGADIVKVFPAGILGPRYFREVKAPLNHAVLMATGGVSADNARAFRDHGADLLGIGGSLVNRQLAEQGCWAEIEERARQMVAAAQ